MPHQPAQWPTHGEFHAGLRACQSRARHSTREYRSRVGAVHRYKVKYMEADDRAHDVGRSSAVRSDWRYHPPTAASSQLSPLPVVRPHTRWCVQPTFVNVRAAPTVRSSILARRFQGDVFESDLEQDGWVRDASVGYASGANGWLLIDGASLGLGTLLHGVGDDTPVGDGQMAHAATGLDRYLPLLTRAPAPVPTLGPLPAGVRAPVRRWRTQRPLTLVYAEPRRTSPVIDVAVQNDLVWSGEVDEAATPSASSSSDQRDWIRLASIDGWVAVTCPSGYSQLARPPFEADWHCDDQEREMEALDLFCQVRVAVHQTYGPAGRLRLTTMFEGWEMEAVELARAATRNPDAWRSLRAERALVAASPFAQTLLSVCHRDVVLEAQAQARRSAARPSDCRRPLLPGETPLSHANVHTLCSEDLLCLDGLLPEAMIAECCREAEALDAAGHLAPPAMHRALGDRRDRLVGLNESTDLLPAASSLGRLVSYLKSLAHELISLGYPEELSVPKSVMLACYDGEGSFYKPHMDSMNTDPRRLTAIVYLVPRDWDATPEADGGQLRWWIVDDESAPAPADAIAEEEGDSKPSLATVLPPAAPPVEHTLDPRAGRLVLFKSRTVMHEVLPTHRKRFALTLWYFDGGQA